MIESRIQNPDKEGKFDLMTRKQTKKLLLEARGLHSLALKNQVDLVGK